MFRGLRDFLPTVTSWEAPATSSDYSLIVRMIV